MKRKNEEKSRRYRGQMGKAYPLSLRTAALRDYLSGMSRKDVAIKYSLPDASVLSQWKRKFAGTNDLKASYAMIKRRNKVQLQTDSESSLSARIKELERALANSQRMLSEKDEELKRERLRNRLNETIIDLAEEQYSIEIRKNFGTKQ